jgi:hypothetical protein
MAEGDLQLVLFAITAFTARDMRPKIHKLIVLPLETDDESMRRRCTTALARRI